MPPNILDAESRDVIARFCTSGTLIAFDYDGTLAPIVSDPAKAAMRPQTRDLLKKVAARHPTAVISGRQRRDVQRFLAGVPLLEVVGNHGAEPFGSPGRVEVLRQVAAWREALMQRLALVPGVFVEDKRLSLSVHYRNAPDPSEALGEIRRVLSDLAGARFIGGQAVINVTPAGSPHKGEALLRLRERLACGKMVYVGDDDTDEDVFALGLPQQLLTIRVGCDRSTAAAYCIENQEQIDELLTALREFG